MFVNFFIVLAVALMAQTGLSQMMTGNEMNF